MYSRCGSHTISDTASRNLLCLFLIIYFWSKEYFHFLDVCSLITSPKLFLQETLWNFCGSGEHKKASQLFHRWTPRDTHLSYPVSEKQLFSAFILPEEEIFSCILLYNWTLVKFFCRFLWWRAAVQCTNPCSALDLGLPYFHFGNILESSSILMLRDR